MIKLISCLAFISLLAGCAMDTGATHTINAMNKDYGHLEATNKAKDALRKRDFLIDEYEFRIEPNESDVTKKLLLQRADGRIIGDIIGTKQFVCVVAEKPGPILGGVASVFLSKDNHTIICIYQGK